MKTLGIHEFTHDAGAAVVTENSILAYEEERFSRKKHHYGFDRGGEFPNRSVSKCLEEFSAGEEPKEAFTSWKTGLFGWYSTKAQILKCYRQADLVHTTTRNSYFVLAKTVFSNYRKRRAAIKKLPYKLKQIPHHRAHASYAYRTSSMHRALIVVIDGSGESQSSSIFIGDKNNIRLLKSYPISQSIGTLYAIVTRLIGLGRDAEGKTMGLSSFGRAIEGTTLLEFDSQKDRFNINYAEVKRLGAELKVSTDHEQTRRDIAATLQRDFNDAMFAFFKHITVKYGERNICFGGGVALNCVFNGLLIKSGIVSKLYIPSAPNDSGCALGAALEGRSRKTDCYALGLGNAFLGYRPDVELSDPQFKQMANDLFGGRVIANCQGRAELGPRALGNRSIFASASKPRIHHHLNTNVKNRETWRPYGVVVLEEDMLDLFGARYDVPYMNIALNATDKARKIIPGCIHVDGSVRVQSVNMHNNPFVYGLLRQFKLLNGYGVLINTSFNDAGEPIVNTEEEAIATYNKTGIDVLYINGRRLEKESKTKRGLHSVA